MGLAMQFEGRRRSSNVPNLTPEEVTELYRQYQDESGQKIEPKVVEQVYQTTQGQPGLVSWFGELLTEKYNPGVEKTIDEETWKLVWQKSRFIEPNNTVMNLINEKQLDEAPITLKELDIIKSFMLPILLGVYRKRLEYPEQNTD